MRNRDKKTLRLDGLPSKVVNDEDHKNDPDITEEKKKELKVVRYGVGFDVHKHIIVVCVQAQLFNATTLEIKSHSFRNTPQGLEELSLFLRKFDPISHYLLECTGVYHLPLVYKLREKFPKNAHKIIPMNPLMIHWRITELGVKHDKADARDIALLSFYDSLLKPSYIGNPHFYSARDTIRSYHKIQTQLTRLKNRITRRLDSINQKFPFEMNSEWSLELMDFYFSKSWSLTDAFNSICKDKIRKGRSTKVLENHQGDLRDCGSIILPHELRFLLQLDLARYLNEDVASSLLIREAERWVLNDPELTLFYQRLLIVPGVGNATALTILLELGDFRRFHRWQSLVKFCGVVPTINKSGSHESKGHVNKFTNQYLRRSLSQAASTIVNRCDRKHDLGKYAYRQRHLRKLPYKKVLMKVAQKLARIVYSILLEGVEYDAHYEHNVRVKRIQERKLNSRNTLLDSPKLRALKRNIQDFLVSNYEYMNSTSKYHLISGCKRMIRKADNLEKDGLM